MRNSLRRSRLLGVVAFLAAAGALSGALATAAVAGAQDERLGPLLQRALADPGGAARQADGTYTVWVYFTDKGLAPAAEAAALAAVERQAPARTLQRRAKVRPAGREVVDTRDLPVAPAYLQAIRGQGAGLRRQSRWLNAASCDADARQIAAVSALPFVAKVELLAKFRRVEPAPTPAERTRTDAARREALSQAAGRADLDYGGSLLELAQINVPPVHDLGINGQGVVLGMLDTGWKLTHEAFAQLEVLAAYDFVNDDPIVADEPGDYPGQHYHGTITLSTIAGYRPGALIGPAFGASVILAKTEDISQEVPIEEDWWVAGLEWVEWLGADVVSSSLGYYDWYTFADLDGNTAVTTIAADLAVDRGVVVVNSAGNARWGFGHIIAPADGHGVIAVGAVASDGAIASFSSPGPTYDGRIKPDVVALGVSNHVVSITDDQGYGTASGTSLSCPLAAGVAALVLARAPGLTPLQVREAMRQTADRALAPDNDYGWGLLDALAAVTYWGAVISHTPLGDTADTAGPYAVTATIGGRLPLDPAQMHVHWRADAGPWQSEPLLPAGGTQWQALLPGQPSGTTLAYYLEVTDTAGVTVREPLAGAAAPHSFLVDSALPVLPQPVTRLVGNLPNPFNPQTTLVFELARGGPVRLGIFDLRGRQVRGLLMADLAAGRHQAVWDGRDDRGRAVAAGIYHARLSTETDTHHHKLSLVR